MSGLPHQHKEEGGAECFVLKNEDYKFDDKLKVTPHPTSWETKFSQSDSNCIVISNFPFLKAFINLAFIAYKNHNKFLCIESKQAETNISASEFLQKLLMFVKILDHVNSSETVKSSQEKEANEADELSHLVDVPEGFEFLAEAKNTSVGNGYYGVAYICRQKRQIVVSHRGTKFSAIGALRTDVMSIFWALYTPQVSSAITFAHQVAQFAQQIKFQLFFTGHSLGAWLAQITCFSTKYLTLNESDHFLMKPPGLWDSLHPYTVVFDSPGALQFLLKMKDELFLRNDPECQLGVNVACLPVEVFQFYPNSVNAANAQIGSVYLVDLDKAGVSYSYIRWGLWNKSITLKTHSVKPVKDFFSKSASQSEDRVLRSRVVDWRIKNWDDFLHKWEEEGRSVGVNLNVFPEYFLMSDELEVLRRQKEKEEFGFYEGLSTEEEETANRIIACSRAIQFLHNGTIHFGEQFDRREAIPIVRHFVTNLRNGRIWWNPSKPQLPSNHIPRRVCRSNQISSDGDPYPTAELQTLMAVREAFVLLSDPPGMGKSTEVSKLEQDLRVKFPTNRIILRVSLNEVQKALSTILAGESVSSVLVKLAPFLPVEALQIPKLINKLFVLLDGLDEVCPRYQDTMINLLRILKSTKETFDIYVVLTTRPHLREVVEEELNAECYSLLPLSIEEQIRYLCAELDFTNEQIPIMRAHVSKSLQNLLSSPLMLFMFLNVLKSKGLAFATDLNMFDLYFQFVESKLKLHLVQKEKMNEEDNSMERRMHSILRRSTPYYNRIAIIELTNLSAIEKSKSVAEEDPSGLMKAELLSFGLVLEDIWGGLVFKHRSFGEFFYARLLLQLATPQGIRDALFGHIYQGYYVLENVEKFVSAALGKEKYKTSLRLTSSWLLLKGFIPSNYRVLPNFVSSRLFPFAAREVLITFVRDGGSDLLPAFLLLVDRMSRRAFTKLVDWMSQNSEWSRSEIFNLPERLLISASSGAFSNAQARLIVSISMIFEGQLLFTADEVKKALESCDRLLFTVASIQTVKMTKWAFVERHLKGTQFRELIKKADQFDWSKIHDDLECVMKLLATFSRDELYSFVSDERTRVTDIVGSETLAVFLKLGTEFLTPLAQFRAKFVDGGNGKTAFELGTCFFKFDYVWCDLVKEMDERNEEGPVTLALREAIGRRSSWEILWKLEHKMRCKRKCPRESEEEVPHVIEWLVRGGSLWDQLTLFPLDLLPFIIRYSGSLKHVTETVQWNRNELAKCNGADEWTTLLKSLLLACSHGCFGSFPLIVTFIHDNIHSIPPDLRYQAKVLMAATEHELRATLIPICSHTLVTDVCFGQPVIRLIGESTAKVDLADIRDVLVDLNCITHCCDIPATLSTMKKVPEKKLSRILLSEKVFHQWWSMLYLRERKREDERCCMRALLSFYFDVFGLNLEWMGEGGWFLDGVRIHLVQKLQVEIAMALEGNPKWSHLVPQFERLVKRYFRDACINTVNELAAHVPYKTEDEWMRLFRMLGEDSFQPGPATARYLSSAFAAPLISACIRTFGMQKARNHLRTVWDQIPYNVEYHEDTPETKASVLHATIRLGELEHVEKFAFPGIASWKNLAGKNAHDVANETLGADHPISVHLNIFLNLSCTKALLPE